MISKVLVVYLCFIYICNSEELLHRKVKRSDIDLQTCLNNFHVQKDKIIRTQDSKDMGAKYINEIDLGSREECSRLCCETENCDVFVFEEKNSGSCYLFQCGPPEDFKCKFTHHANYSSAILAINRHLPDLESQIKLTKHEQDLKINYRKPEDDPVTQKSQISTTASTLTSTKIHPIVTTSKSVNEAVKCSRYQFECRSTKECIAIYNACDGIPQCADGSDEAQELGCPDAGTTSSPSRTRPNIPYEEASVVQNRPPPVPVQKIYPAQQPSSVNGQRAENDFIRPDNRNAFIPLPPAYNNDAPGPIYSQNQPPPNWMSQHLNQLPPQYPPYRDKNSHIFNHKENGIQVSEGQGIRYNKHKGAMQILHQALGYSSAAGQPSYGEPDAHDNQKFINYIDEMYRQHPQYPEKWQTTNQADANSRNPFIQAMDQTSRTNWVQTRPQENEQQPGGPIDKEIDDHEHKKMAYDLQHSKDLMEKSVSSKDQKIKIEKHITHENIPFTKSAQYKMELDLQDGIAETPGGAVLSLTLGLIITCVMALLIGCRLRMVRRRIRRGGKSYAHDADYLVNGMYL